MTNTLWAGVVVTTEDQYAMLARVAGHWLVEPQPKPIPIGADSGCEDKAIYIAVNRNGGINENTNRLLRQYLPKGADLRRFSQADLNAIAHELNYRPRKIHGYRTPAEVSADCLNSGDALTA